MSADVDGAALAGEAATCPSCEGVLRAGAMIPILDAGALAYRCPACASALGRNEAPSAAGTDTGGH